MQAAFLIQAMLIPNRYFLFIAFPFVLLAAKGIVDIISRGWIRFVGVLFFITLIVSALFASHHLTRQAKHNIHYKKALLLDQVIRFVPDEAYIIDESAAFVNLITIKRSIQADLFVGGNHPEKVVFLKGKMNDVLNTEDPETIVLVKKTLDTDYRCRPLTVSPLYAGYLSATPFLCTLLSTKILPDQPAKHF